MLRFRKPLYSVALALLFLGSSATSVHFARHKNLSGLLREAGYIKHNWGYEFRMPLSRLGVVEMGVFDTDEKRGYWCVELTTEYYPLRYYIFPDPDGKDAAMNRVAIYVGLDTPYVQFEEILLDNSDDSRIFEVTIYSYVDPSSYFVYQDLDLDGDFDVILWQTDGRWESLTRYGSDFVSEN